VTSPAALDLTPYRAFLIELAEASGAFIRPYFGLQGLAVETKADDTPVTVADRGAEALMRDLITQRFPQHGIIGEEYGEHDPNAEFVWVLDPVDGTKAFATGCPLFGTLIALQYQGRPVLGAIHQPVLGQLLVGDGHETTLNRAVVRTRPCDTIEAATLLCTDLLDVERHQDGAAFAAVSRRARLVRTWGDCYGYLLVASGWADVMCDPEMNPWDIAALVPVIEGAGGVITGWQGDDPVGAASTIACGSPGLHRAVIAALNPRH